MSLSFLFARYFCSRKGNARTGRSLFSFFATAALLRGDAPPIFFLRHQKENAPRPVEKKKCWCPNPAWRQVRAKTGVLARKRRIFAVWSPRWARALCLRKLQVVSPRRYAGTHHGYESNWYPPLSPLPLRSHKIQRSGSGRRNQWNTGDGNTVRPAGRDSKREAEPVRFHPRFRTQRSNTRHKHLLRSRYSAPG